MAFAQVQTSTQATTTGNTLNITVSPTVANNLVVVHIKIASNAETCTSVTDDKGNAYVLSSVLDAGTTNRTYQAYGVQVTGGVTAITVNFSAAVVSKRCGADEYSGGETSNAAIFDEASTGTALLSTSVSCSPAITPTATGELIVATISADATKTWTAGANYTLYNGVGVVSMRSQYRLSGTASETAPCTVNSNGNLSVIATAFKLLTPATAFKIFGDEQMVA